MLGAFNQQLFEEADLASFFKPVDLTTGANTGAWLSMRDYHRVAIVLVRAGSSGNASDQSTVTVQQAQDSSGTNAKALNSYRLTTKGDMTTAAGDLQTIADVTVAANTWKSPSGKGDKETLTIIDIEGQLFDDANGFHWLQASVDQAAHTCLGWCFALFYSNRHSQRPPVSSLTNL